MAGRTDRSEEAGQGFPPAHGKVLWKEGCNEDEKGGKTTKVVLTVNKRTRFDAGNGGGFI